MIVGWVKGNGRCDRDEPLCSCCSGEDENEEKEEKKSDAGKLEKNCDDDDVVVPGLQATLRNKRAAAEVTSTPRNARPRRAKG